MGRKIIDLLDGQRFDDEANLVYKVPIEKLPKKKMYDKKS
jgi:hypothetical protein